MGVCAIVSFRLGLSDGVSVVAGLWAKAIGDMGWVTYTVAGEGPVDRVVPGLAIDAAAPPTIHELQAALDQADIVLVENILSIPLNLPASRVLAEVLAGRPALLHHHDPPWQRERFAHITELPPDDPQWRHVTINRMTERQFAERGIAAETIYNGFDIDPPAGDRTATRQWLGLGVDDLLFAHPVRAIARKNIPKAIELAEALNATYWLPGDAEEGYGPELERILDSADCTVLRQPLTTNRHDINDLDPNDHDINDLYAACDLVVFPSTWEGFGNPPIEAALHRRLAAVGSYPVADELRALGFQWFDPDDADTIASALKRWPDEILDRNQQLAREHLSVGRTAREVARLFTESGWAP